jgi:hypothetical protein
MEIELLSHIDQRLEGLQAQLQSLTESSIRGGQVLRVRDCQERY